MRKIKYFLQFIIIILFFFIFKILGIKLASFLSGKIFQIVGPLFRSKELINSNIKIAFPKIDERDLKKYLPACGIIMEESLQNICLLKNLEMES